MSDLSRVRSALQVKTEAEAAYRDAVVDAHAAGATFAELASELGVSRQAVRQLINRAASDESRLRARLEELDQRYDNMVTGLAAQYRPGDYKRVTAYQNAMSRKLKRKGLAYRPVSVQARDHVESMLLNLLENRQDLPEVRAFIAEMDEASAIRKRLTTLDETRAFGSPLS